MLFIALLSGVKFENMLACFQWGNSASSAVWLKFSPT